MQVLHYCDQFSLLTESFIYDFVMELERQDVDNHVACRARANPDSRPFPKVTTVPALARLAPLRVLSGARALLRRRPTEERYWFAQRRLIERILREHQPQLVHAHFGPAAVLVAPVARRCGIPVVASFYGYDASELPRSARWRRHYQALWPRLDAALVLSNDMKSDLVELGCAEEKQEVVHLSRHLQARQIHAPQRIRRFLSVGRLVEKKGHDDAIRAMQIVVRHYPDARLEIIGSGPLEDQLRELVAKLQMGDHVTFRGTLPNAETMESLERSDAFLLLSKTASSGDKEGTPTVLVEAQLKGLPCISTTHAGIPEMLPDANHWTLGPEADAEAAAERMLTLIRSPAEQVQHLCELGSDFVQARFDLGAETGKLRGLYQRFARA